MHATNATLAETAAWCAKQEVASVTLPSSTPSVMKSRPTHAFAFLPPPFYTRFRHQEKTDL